MQNPADQSVSRKTIAFQDSACCLCFVFGPPKNVVDEPDLSESSSFFIDESFPICSQHTSEMRYSDEELLHARRVFEAWHRKTCTDECYLIALRLNGELDDETRIVDAKWLQKLIAGYCEDPELFVNFIEKEREV